MPNAALILAAGRGSRIQTLATDKILVPLAGRSVITYSVEAFLASDCVATIAIIYRNEEQRIALEESLISRQIDIHDFFWIRGGDERRDSVLSGLRALPDTTGHVFIHDAARPLISPEIIRTLAAKVEITGAASVARRVTDTIKQARSTDDAANGAFALRTIDRVHLWAAETPQVFRHSLILSAYEKACAEGLPITDDTATLEKAGHPVSLVETSSPNPKLTTPADFAYLEYLLTRKTTK